MTREEAFQVLLGVVEEQHPGCKLLDMKVSMSEHRQLTAEDFLDLADAMQNAEYISLEELESRG